MTATQQTMGDIVPVPSAALVAAGELYAGLLALWMAKHNEAETAKKDLREIMESEEIEQFVVTVANVRFQVTAETTVPETKIRIKKLKEEN